MKYRALSVLLSLLTLSIFLTTSQSTTLYGCWIPSMYGGTSTHTVDGTIYDGLNTHHKHDTIIVETIGTVIDEGTHAVGINSGHGNDTIKNKGSILVTGSVVASTSSKQGYCKSPIKQKSTAVGIKTGKGNDEVVNSGKILVAASSVLNDGSEDLTTSKKKYAVSFKKKGYGKDLYKLKMTYAAAIGIDTEAGNDFVENTGTIDVTATTEMYDTGNAMSTAIGINRGYGESMIVNEGEIQVSASALVEADSTSFTVFKDYCSKKTFFDGSLTAISRATGIHSDYAKKTEAGVENTAVIDVKAESHVNLKSFSLSVADMDIVDTSIHADSKAVGIECDKGKETITNKGTISVSALSTTATSGFDMAFFDRFHTTSKSISEASAVGIYSGKCDDTIINTGNITVVAEAEAAGVSAEVSGVAKAELDATTKAEATAKGIDTDENNVFIENEGDIEAIANAVVTSIDSTITGVGLSALHSKAEAHAEAVGIDTGKGSDEIINSGNIKADATAVTAGLSATVSGVGAAAEWDGGTEATAKARGIDSGAHNDLIVNDGVIDVHATAVNPSVDVALTGIGLSVVDSSVRAEAEAIGIDAGTGDDEIVNRGNIRASAVANADSLSVAVTGIGAAAAGDDAWKGGIESEAAAKGIDAGSGSNSVVNEGDMEVSATAVTASAGVSVVGGGFAHFDSSVRAEAEAIGIDAGEDTQEIVNLGNITVDATAVAAGMNVGVTGLGESELEGGTEATAVAKGIDAGDGITGNDITNSGDIDVSATVVAPEIGISITGYGISNAKSGSSGKAEAIGIDAGGGDDEIINSGTITADATSVAVGLGVSVTGVGESELEGGTDAAAVAKGIDAGEDNDLVINEGDIVISATVVAPDIGVSIAVDGDAGAASKAKASAEAIGIDAGGGDDEIINSGAITADATSVAVGLGVAVSGEGDAKLEGGTEAAAVAKGIDAGDGNDVIMNEGAIDVTATVVSPEIEVAVTGEGMSSTKTSASAEAEAIGIDAGSGDDEIINSGAITANATSVGAGISVAVSGEGETSVGDEEWEGGIESKATAKGIDAGSGSDSVVNLGDMDISATAVTASVGVSVAGKKEASFDSSVKAEAEAIGIDAGENTQEIVNGGKIIADAVAVPVGLNVSVSYGKEEGENGGQEEEGEDKGVWNGTTEGTAVAKGIDAGEGDVDNLIVNSGDIDISAAAVAPEIGVSVTMDGDASAESKAKTSAEAIGIDAGGGDDQIINSGVITADAASVAVGLGVAVSGEGDAELEGGTEAAATAKGIDAGEGADMIMNKGDIALSASAVSPEIEVAVTGEGLSSTKTSASAEAETTGIDAGAGDDMILNSGAITANANSVAVALGVAVSGEAGGIEDLEDIEGVIESIWDGSTEAVAKSKGIDAGGGDDYISNEAEIDVSAVAIAPAIDVEVTGEGTGLNAAITTSSSSAEAVGIDAGEGDDQIFNTGTIKASAVSNADAVTVAVADKGVAATANDVWDGGVESTAVAKGIDAGGGDNTIMNEGDIEATSTAVTASVGVSVVEKGIATSVSTAKAEAESIGIDMGEETERIENSGDIKAGATAVAGTVNVDVTGKGIAAAVDSVWEGGTTATATAKGIEANDMDNVILNEGDIEVTTEAVAPSLGVAVAGKGLSAAVSTATSSAESIGIDAGEGDDQIVNTGAIKANAVSNADAVAVSVAGKGVAATASDVWDGGVESTAVAKGIDVGGGDNTITNEGDIEANSTAVTASVGVSVVGKGIAASVSTSIAEAESIGIDMGEETKRIDNSGDIEAGATAVAVTANVDVSGTGVAAAVDAVWDGGTTATATAKGIEANDMDNTIVNEGNIEVNASAISPSVGVAVAGKGLSAAVSTATSSAESVGIYAGEGKNSIENSGEIVADASSVGVTATVSVAGKGIAGAAGAVWDGGTKSTATAKGISSGDDEDIITNTAKITAESDAVTVEAGIAVTGIGIGAAVTTSTTVAESYGIYAGEGKNSIENSGEIVADASSVGVSASVAVAGKGIVGAAGAVWDGGTKSTATAKGISTGDDEDMITNSGKITAESDAVTVEAGIAVTGMGIGAAVTTSTTVAESYGIDAGEGKNSVENSGEIVADASAVGVSASISVAGKGIAGAAGAVWDGGTKSTATAKGISTGDDDDVITNSGKITAESDAVAVEAGIAVAGTGIGAAVNTSTTVAESVGIDAGEGKNSVENSGEIVADASAVGVTASISVAGTGIAGAAGAVWDGGTKSTATAKGISTGDDDDVITNSGKITAESDAVTVEAGIAVAGTGIGAAVTTSTTEAEAIGIDAGEGMNTVQNSGEIVSDASSVGVSASISVAGTGIAGSAGAVWDGGTKSTAVAKGIGSGDGDDVITNTGNITVESDAVTVEAGIAVAGTGIGAAVTTSTTEAEAIGIDAAEGNNSIDNTGEITADASSVGVSASISVAGTGIAGSAGAVWDGGTKSTATAKGIGTGDGDDVITNSGNITVESDAVTVEAGIAVAGTGIGAAVTTSTTEAEAIGIDAAEGNNSIDNTGEIIASASTTGVGVGVAVTGVGLSGAADAVWDGGTESTTTVKGIRTGSGEDTIDNSGKITATSEANTIAVQAAIAGKGIAVATTTSTTTAHATGIESGAGIDAINNSGDIIADASSSGVSVAAAITGIGLSGATDAVWDSGTTATSVAKGIDGGAGDDSITNTGNISVTSEADTVVVDAAISGIGITAALTDTTVTAQAVGIDGGDGSDFIHNEGSILGDVDATAIGVGASIAGAGINVAGADLWDNGISGEAMFTGIDGGSGSDTIENSGAIEANVLATTPAVSVALSGVGIGGAATTSTANAQATGISGGVGEDHIINEGSINLASIADATTVNVSATLAGVVVTADKVWDGGTTATAVATGIDAGSEQDTIENSASIVVSSDADTSSVGVSAAMAGITGTVASSTTDARSTGIEGGTGDDIISNTGNISASSYSDADTVIVSASLVGISGGADSFWDGGTTATAQATGIDGDDGNDTITNSGAIDARAEANTGSTGVTATLVGASATLVNSTAVATAAGIEGGAGDDAISNTGNITVVTQSDAETCAVSASVVGASFAGDQWSEDTLAKATAIGINGGAGNDTISNEGNVTATATSYADASAVTVSLVGYADSEAENISEATAIGITGGDGMDDITNSGDIVLTSRANGDAGSVTVNLLGAAPAEVGTAATAVGTGIDGGEDDDTIHNEGNITISSTATTDASQVTVALVGYGNANAGAASLAVATGIAGGGGDDDIINSGDITMWSSSSSNADSVTVSLAGAAPAEASTTVMAYGTGIDGGSGNDSITNDGNITIAANVAYNSSTVNVPVFGYGNTDVSVTAYAAATGVSGGTGEDDIINRGDITLSSGASLATGADTVNVAGVTGVDSSMTYTATATGIDGGTGDDTVRNEGNIDVNAASSGSSSGSAVGIFGAADSDAAYQGITYATGIEGGDGNDVIDNLAKIVVGSSSTLIVDQSTFTFGGTGDAGGTLEATTTSTGISGGIGSDQIRSEGDMEVSASSSFTSTGGSDAAFGTTDAGISSGAVTNAIGIDGGEGDDSIENLAAVTVHSTSTLTADQTTFTFGGTGDAGGTLEAKTSATGISGGTGSDQIRSEGDVKVSGSSSFSTAGDSDAAFGTTDAGISSGAFAKAIGIDGGEGDDSIENLAAIEVNSASNLTADQSTFTFGGTGDAGGTLAAKTSATGISGSAGSDQIRSEGAIEVSAASSLTSKSGSDTVFGTSDANATSGAFTDATGIDGGAGDDVIENLSTIDITSSSALSLDGSSYTFGGTSDEEGKLIALTKSIGISGGAGIDTIRNEGGISIEASSTIYAKGEVESTFGTADTGALTVADTSSVGIDGGAEDDRIENLSTISVKSTTTMTSEKSAYVFGGSSKTGAVLAALSQSTGIAGGDGADWIYNSNSIVVDAVSNLASTGGSYTEFGGSKSRGAVNSKVKSIGIDGGDGGNTTQSFGNIQVYGSATAFSEDIAETGWLVGDGDAGSKTDITVEGYGISVGNGNNEVLNENGILVELGGTSHAKTYSDGADIADGDARSTSQAAAYAEGAAIRAGNGDNQITNNGTLDVSTSRSGWLGFPVTALAESRADGDGIDGDGTAVSLATVETRATGIQSGDGDSSIDNNGTINVTAVNWGSAKANADADEQGTDRTIVVVTSKAYATGIQAGEGAQQITNTGTIHVTAAPTAVTLEALSDGGSQFGNVDAAASAVATMYAEAIGIKTGHGDANIVNNGGINVTANPVVILLYAKADGDGINGSGDAAGSATIETLATGIQTGNGDQTIGNGGEISVKATSTFNSAVVSDGDEDSHAKSAIAAIVTANATGILTGNGNSSITNTGTILVEATPEVAGAYASSDGGAPFSPVHSTSVSLVNITSLATGIRAGTGNNLILNQGEITVISNPIGIAASSADGDGAGGDGVAIARSNVHSIATGIWTGYGQNEISNVGTIDVTSFSKADTSASADGDSIGGNASATAISAAVSSAYGIKTGDGADTITNDGTIKAVAISVPTSSTSATVDHFIVPLGTRSQTSLFTGVAEAVGISAGNGNNYIVNNGTIEVVAAAIGNGAGTSASTYGIKTGSGDDTVVNNGTITTINNINGSVYKGTAVDMGTGNDLLILGTGSVMACDVDLGVGDDGLTVIGTATVSGEVYGGEGTDSLTLDGATNFDLDRTHSFEAMAKYGTSTVTIGEAEALETLELHNGVLQVLSNYQFKDTTKFSASVHGNGSCGQLLLEGTGIVNGTMTVDRGRGAFVNGSTYDVVMAKELVGEFDEVILPDPTPLLKFDFSRYDVGYLISASTQSFTTVAENRIENTIAEHLDTVIYGASGDFANVLGEIQAIPALGYDIAFASLSPDSYGCATRTGLDLTQQYTSSLLDRMHGLRVASNSESKHSDENTIVDLSASNSDRISGSSLPDLYGAWLGGFGQWGGFDAYNGYTGFDYNLQGLSVGYDHGFGQSFVAGVGLGLSSADIDLHDGWGMGNIAAVTGSAYGGYNSGQLYIDTAMSFARQNFINERNLLIGTLDRTANSEHVGNTFSIVTETGYDISSSAWIVQPVAALQYIYLKEEKFEESGAEGVNLIVSERKTNSLVSDLGFRLGHIFNIGSSKLVPELSASWKYDFGIDSGAINAAYTGSPDAFFSIDGQGVSQNRAVVGASLMFMGRASMSASLRYSTELQQGSAAHGLSGDFHYSF